MHTPNERPTARPDARATLELAVRDPMAAARHITGLLSRRAYRLLAMACLSAPDGGGRVLLEVADDGRTDRLAIELAHLPEVASASLGQSRHLTDLLRLAPVG